MPLEKPLTHAELKSLIADTFIRGTTYFEQTDSTNTQAMALLGSEQKITTPHVVYAESQNSGRGRGANLWWSTAGSLTFSVIIDCAELGLTREQQSQLPLLTGLAVLRTGQTVLPTGEFSVKWPNDVYLAGRKLAGILIEVPAATPRLAVIGVGLNVNNSFAKPPSQRPGKRQRHDSSDLAAIAISLADQAGTAFDRENLLGEFFQQLARTIASLAQGENPLREWPQHCLLMGQQVTLQTGPTEVTGLCQGIDATGALILKTEQGLQRFLGGVVKSFCRSF